MQQKNGDRPMVVMVDDDGDFQTIVQGWLVPYYDFVILSNGEGLMEELDEVDAALVILDVNMPGPDGFKLCKRIRADQRFSDLPILFVTGRTEDDAFIKNIDAGGTAYLTKPVDRKKLLAMIKELLPSQRSTRRRFA